MASESDICNFALSKIGEHEINSLADTSAQAKACNRWYAQTRDEVCIAHRWRCLTRRSSLTRLAADPIWGWAAQYQLPADYLRLIEINGINVWTPEEWFTVEGTMLLTDLAPTSTDPVGIIYIARVVPTGDYHPLLVEAIYTKLAAHLSRILTGSDGREAQLLQEYERVVSKAGMVDAFVSASNENNSVRTQTLRSRMVSARNRGSW